MFSLSAAAWRFLGDTMKRYLLSSAEAEDERLHPGLRREPAALLTAGTGATFGCGDYSRLAVLQCNRALARLRYCWVPGNSLVHEIEDRTLFECGRNCASAKLPDYLKNVGPFSLTRERLGQSSTHNHLERDERRRSSGSE
jgi:hypothetical protein